MTIDFRPLGTTNKHGPRLLTESIPYFRVGVID
jgi:hypothetical protein